MLCICVYIHVYIFPHSCVYEKSIYTEEDCIHIGLIVINARAMCYVLQFYLVIIEIRFLKINVSFNDARTAYLVYIYIGSPIMTIDVFQNYHACSYLNFVSRVTWL